ncbi:hypothetical protein H2201_001610 [Coniosporium apollinis]|uniref:Delta(24)-sterol reductase n=1 Tax=Coniosporium apollinis TaxID=61459 RepID=A0ABQ9P4F2_9PEZI|nr:hypothetical protein H2201_001610 [Coniosporium apollinis]
MDRHHDAVARIAQQVKSFHERKVPFRVYHGSTNSTRLISFDPDKIVDTSPLSHVISIDKAAKVAIVEPNVPMDKLVEATLAEGFVPLVVPEFPGITVGGSYSGTAAESSSFKYGYFDRSVNWVEIVLANGDIVKTSADENPELFYGAVGACGTLGVTTLFEIQLQPSGSYVELTYHPTASAREALSLLNRSAREDWDYIDGILFSETSGVIMLGRITHTRTPNLPILRFTRARDPWFFLHAHTKATHARHTYCDTCILAQHNPSAPSPALIPRTELVPPADYFFRYDRGTFWMGAYGWPAWLFNRLGRFLLDPLLRTRVRYKALHHGGGSQRFIIQDLAIPGAKSEEFVDWVDAELGVWPLWLCPVRADSRAPLHAANRSVASPVEGSAVGEGKAEVEDGGVSSDLLVNVGVWGVSQGMWDRYNAGDKTGAYDRFVADNRALEATVKRLGGLKWLYAHNYYTEAEFWEIYDKQAYEELREKWGVGGLPSLWDKMKRSSEGYQSRSFSKAILAALMGKEHLLVKGKKRK